MANPKKRLLQIAKKHTGALPLTPDEIEYLLTFQKKNTQPKLATYLKQAALPLSLALGFLYTVFPREFESGIARLPGWTNFSPNLLVGVDYLWDLLGEPVKKANIIYHIPNIMLYSFGIFGVKKLFDVLDKKTWLDRVLDIQKRVREQVEQGVQQYALSRGHSLLFVGNGDFIGMQFVLDHKKNEVITISQTKPSYTPYWSVYSADTLFEDLKTVLIRCDGQGAGEYIFFPVKDDQLFLPGPKAYDLSPHKLDLLCQNIRTIEKEQKWKNKRIIIIGDKTHTSFVQSEDQHKIIPKSGDTISLHSIAAKYVKTTLLDPTDIVLRNIIDIAQGRQIIFRATRDGLKEYKSRFYSRLKQLGYKRNLKKRGVLTIGYDLFEDQTEQQTLSRKIDDYYPVVLSKNVRDALIRNGYQESEFIYVPHLVLQALSYAAAQQ